MYKYHYGFFWFTKQFINENHTKYLYLTESNCMQIHRYIYNPFLYDEEKKYEDNK